MSRRVEFRCPQFPPAARIEGPEVAVDRRADEHEVPRGRHRAAETRRAGLDPFLVELFENAERHAPYDVAGVGAYRNQLAPRRLVARIAMVRLPEAAAFGRHLAVRRTSARRVVVGAASTAEPTRTATTASFAWFHFL